METPRRLWQALFNRTPDAKAAEADRTYGEIARLLTQPRGPEAQTALDQIARLLIQQPQNAELAARIARGGTLTLGSNGYAVGSQYGAGR